MLVESTPRSHDTELQRRLWRESQRLTGVIYEFTATGLGWRRDSLRSFQTGSTANGPCCRVNSNRSGLNRGGLAAGVCRPHAPTTGSDTRSAAGPDAGRYRAESCSKPAGSLRFRSEPGVSLLIVGAIHLASVRPAIWEAWSMASFELEDEEFVGSTVR